MLPEYRGNGIGTHLLSSVLDAAKAIYPAISLSVRKTNPALRLYQRLGFKFVEGSDTINRTGGISGTMKLDFSPSER